ncbi:MAG: RNA polymerase sigma factor SigJ [Gemmatimonadaceae bacterium]|nr:RNA polymerase sigma factor SigJ [Gemmatimonadaceae bacterium]
MSHLDAPPDERATALERHRPKMFGIAYRMLGSVEDAEDVVQEAYLRWHQAEPEDVRSPEAWLVAVVTRIAIDRLRHAAVERAAYVGPWLPEPLVTSSIPAADRSAELTSDLSMAFLLLLERLTPEERAALVLREVFDTSYAELARILERNEAACRQIVHRARARVRREQRRFQATPADREQLVERFLAALAAEDEKALLDLLADDVVWVSDGGGKAPALREIVSGAARVAPLAIKFERMGRGRTTHQLVWLNGELGLLTLADGLTVHATSFAIAEGRIAAVYRILNPDKLHHVGPPPLWPMVPRP